MDMHDSVREWYPNVSIGGRRITRMEETPISSFHLSSETAWTLGADNVGLFVGGIDSLRSIVESLRRLESSGTTPKWIVISASKSIAALVVQMWVTPDDEDIVVKMPSLPQLRNNIVLATPESLKRIDGSVNHHIAGVILIDMLCHVHRARHMPGPAGRFVSNDRPQMIVDFRNSVGFKGWVPPLILLTEERAKSVHTDFIARAYCLDGFWFLDGQTFGVEHSDHVRN
jgi:hypothetical protein